MPSNTQAEEQLKEANDYYEKLTDQTLRQFNEIKNKLEKVVRFDLDQLANEADMKSVKEDQRRTQIERNGIQLSGKIMDGFKDCEGVDNPLKRKTRSNSKN